MASDPNNQKAIEQFNQGLQLHQNGNLDAASACYQSALALAPKFSPALQYLGVIAAQNHDFVRAVELISKAIELNPLDPNAYLNRGLAHAALKKHENSLKDFQQARMISPGHVEAFFNEGNALQELRRYPEAVAAYQQAIALAPQYAQAFNNLGNAQQELKQFDQALKSYEKAIAIAPDYAEAFFNCGTLFQSIKNYKTAIQCFDRCITLDPQAIEAYVNNGDNYDELVETKKAIECYEQALAINPKSLEARFAKALSQIPKLYAKGENPRDYREQLIAEINSLDQWIASNPHPDGYKVVGSHQPFFLAYQEENNVNILKQYGDICDRLMKEIQPTIVKQRGVLPGKIRLGIISSHIHTHSVWNAITKGWLVNLNPADFEICLFHLGETNDDETTIAKSLSSSYIQGNLPIEEWVRIVADAHLDIVLFPEVGMDRLTCQLAALRLAPKQLVAWGHPETTGLPNLDYYISAADFETSNSQENYSEKLIALPNLGCFYTPYQGPVQTIDLSELGLNEEHPILLCPGTPFKYAPQFDYVLPEIAKHIKNAQLVFFDFPDMPIHILKERLSSAFTSTGLKMDDHVKFIPKQSPAKFYGLMKRADVFIDTLGFSGFNTAIQAIECDLPVVTYDGKFMRGKLARGILKRMGLNELIAPNPDEFILKVAKVANDSSYRSAMKSKIASTKQILFEDLEPVKALNQFLLEIAR